MKDLPPRIGHGSCNPAVFFDYLNYKAGQLTQEDAYANCNNGG